MEPTFIFLAIIYTLILLIWTKVNNTGSRDNLGERQKLNREIDELRERNREVEGIRIIFRDGSDFTFDEARTYRYDYRDEAYIIKDADRETISEFPKIEVRAILVERKGENDGY